MSTTGLSERDWQIRHEGHSVPLVTIRPGSRYDKVTFTAALAGAMIERGHGAP